MWLKFELLSWHLVLHVFETCHVTLTVYLLFGYLTILFNMANRLYILWKEALLYFVSNFLKRMRKTAIVTQQVLGHDLNSGNRSMN